MTSAVGSGRAEWNVDLTVCSKQWTGMGEWKVR